MALLHLSKYHCRFDFCNSNDVLTLRGVDKGSTQSRFDGCAIDQAIHFCAKMSNCMLAKPARMEAEANGRRCSIAEAVQSSGSINRALHCYYSRFQRVCMHVHTMTRCWLSCLLRRVWRKIICIEALL